MGDARGLGVTVSRRLGGVMLGCGLLAGLSLPAAPPRLRLAGNPNPPSTAQINAAENQVRRHQAALGAEQGRLSARRPDRRRPPGRLSPTASRAG